MTVFMLRDPDTGLFYRRGSATNCWVEQQKASIWTSRVGPSIAKAAVRDERYAYRHTKRPVPEIVEFELVEKS